MTPTEAMPTTAFFMPTGVASPYMDSIFLRAIREKERAILVDSVFHSSTKVQDLIAGAAPVRTFSTALAYYNKDEMLFSTAEYKALIRSFTATLAAVILGFVTYSFGSVGWLPFLVATLVFFSQPVSAQGSCDWRSQSQCSPSIGCTWTGASCIDGIRSAFTRGLPHAVQPAASIDFVTPLRLIGATVFVCNYNAWLPYVRERFESRRVSQPAEQKTNEAAVTTQVDELLRRMKSHVSTDRDDAETLSGLRSYCSMPFVFKHHDFLS